jgi:cytochrome c oxidase subunit 4
MTPSPAHSATVPYAEPSTGRHSAGDHAHPDELGAYLKVFTALMVLLAATVGAYYIPFEKLEIGGHDLGFVNTVVALIIATVKASLVMLVFMHLRHSTRLTWVIAAAGFVFLSIMITFTFLDYQSRGSIKENRFDPPGKGYESQVLQERAKTLDETPGW